MVKRTTLISVLCLLLSISLFSKNIDQETAARIARNFYFEQVNQFKDLAISDINITSVYIQEENKTPLYYIFNINNAGFVMVAAENNVVPVLGYSFENVWTGNDLPSECRNWVDNYKTQIKYHRANKTASDEAITNAWQHFSTTNVSQLKSLKGAKAVTPLLISTWDQGAYYNDFCPLDAQAPMGYNGRVPVGCVATAMSQIMYYYRYPIQGQGSHSYNSNYGSHSANFGTTTYRWDEMLNGLYKTNVPVATLCYHAAVSVNMGFSAAGSGASSQTAASSLKTYFKYSSTLAYKSKSAYTETNWTNLMKAQLDAKKPVYYDGYGNQGGHAFVMDGYQGTNYFHFNWGWSGSANGYYYLSNLNPNGDNFTSGQGAIIDIYPASGYPYSCTGSKTITTLEGTLEDGSGPANNYPANNDCYYLFTPQATADDSINNISITFNRFSTETTNDLVTVYDGATTSAPVIGTYSGSSLPPTVTSTGNQLLLHFTSNTSIAADGWLLTYQATRPVYCSGVTTLTGVSGSFGDGSGTKSYNNMSICQWLIKPPAAASIKLHFQSFNTEAVNDYVEVYAYDTLANTGSLLGTFSGNSLPPDQFSYTGAMSVIFISSDSTVVQGWAVSYSSSNNVGIDGITVLKDLSIYPNPATSKLNISFEPGNTSFITTGLYTITGQEAYITTNKEIMGTFRETISLDELAKGIYFLKITTDSGTVTRKIVVQ
jgi:hypothetical protein